MVFLPTTNLARLLLATIILLYISLLVLNLVSFGGIGWITYVDYNVQFGLWRICYGAISAARTTCFQWADSPIIIDTVTGTIIFSGKPNFVRAAEGLETISLIFYIFAGVLIIMGIIDLDKAPLETMFAAAAVLLFLCVVFISASLGVMSVQGRSNHPGAHRDWAWRTGIAGLVITIVCVILLIGFIIYMARFYPSAMDNTTNFGQIYQYEGQQPWNSFPPVMTAQGVPPMSFLYPANSQWLPEYQAGQFNSNGYVQNPFLAPTDVNQQAISPVLTALVQQRLFDLPEVQRL